MRTVHIIHERQTSQVACTCIEPYRNCVFINQWKITRNAISIARATPMNLTCQVSMETANNAYYFLTRICQIGCYSIKATQTKEYSSFKLITITLFVSTVIPSKHYKPINKISAKDYKVKTVDMCPVPENHLTTEKDASVNNIHSDAEQQRLRVQQWRDETLLRYFGPNNNRSGVRSDLLRTFDYIRLQIGWIPPPPPPPPPSRQ